MASFRKFEDITAWQRARDLSLAIYRATSDAAFARDFGLRDQIRRSAVSIMANIAEGFGRRTNKDFASFLVIAHGSAAETQSHLYLALDLGYISDETFHHIYQQPDEISRMTKALNLHLRRTNR
jgi:four helix bundle protein